MELGEAQVEVHHLKLIQEQQTLVVAVVVIMIVQKEQEDLEDQVVEAQVIVAQQELQELLVKEIQVEMVYTHKVVGAVADILLLVQMLPLQIQVEQVEQA